MTRARKVLFAALTVLLATGIALVAADVFLTWQRGQIQRSGRLDPGLLDYDRRIGWRLTPGWEGRDRHHDFDVGYRIGAHGMRGAEPSSGAAERVVLLGDSFTFAIGVGEEDTFARRLARDGREVLNFGVPGTSTDQQLLLLEDRVLPLEPDVVVLVVCLINDVLDNPRPFPLQADNAKPRYLLRGDRLVLDRVPVPRERKPAGKGQADLDRLVYGLDRGRPRGIAAKLGRREVFRRLGLFQPRPEVSDAQLRERYAEPLELFDAIVARIRERVEGAGARFLLALIPGRSYVERPASYAHRYQDHLRREIVATWEARGVPVVDLASALAQSHAAASGPWYHPHEGHLNAEGNAEVARLLDEALR